MLLLLSVWIACSKYYTSIARKKATSFYMNEKGSNETHRRFVVMHHSGRKCEDRWVFRNDIIIRGARKYQESEACNTASC